MGKSGGDHLVDWGSCAFVVALWQGRRVEYEEFVGLDNLGREKCFSRTSLIVGIQRIPMRKTDSPR